MLGYSQTISVLTTGDIVSILMTPYCGTNTRLDTRTRCSLRSPHLLADLLAVGQVLYELLILGLGVVLRAALVNVLVLSS